MLDREQKLNAAGAGADHCDPRAPIAREHARDQRLEAGEEAVDGLDRDGVLARARHIRGVRRRADVEREQIVRHRRAVATDHGTRGEIEADDLVLIEPRLRKTGQRPGVDMGVVEPVIPGDEAGQHAGIRCMHLAGDQSEAHARNRLHAEHAQHGHMRVASTDQHHVLDDRMGHALHADLSSPTGPRSGASLGAYESRVGMVSMRNRRRRPRENASTAIASAAVTRIRTIATSSLNSEMAAST